VSIIDPFIKKPKKQHTKIVATGNGLQKGEERQDIDTRDAMKRQKKDWKRMLKPENSLKGTVPGT